jgi:YbbR domain-containing protein
LANQRKWHIFILSLLFSFVLWASINLGGKYQAFIDVDLVVTNLPAEKAIVNPLPKSLNIKFSGTGWQLATLYFNPNVRYELSLAMQKEKRTINLKQNVLENLKVPFKIDAIEVLPESLNIMYDDYFQKKVPVIPIVRVNCSKGYGVVGNIITNPDSITIGGAARIIRNINSWRTVFQQFDDIKNDVIALLPLSDSLSQVTQISHKVVGVDINVQMVAEENIKDVEIIIRNKPANIDLSIIPPRVDVLIRSGVDYLTGFDRNQVKAEIDFNELSHDSLRVFVPVFSVPKEVKIIRIYPVKFEYVIRKSR